MWETINSQRPATVMQRFMGTKTLFLLVLLTISEALVLYDRQSTATDTCVQIQASISAASAVSFAGTPLYIKDVSHWASSSSDVAACSVEPGTLEDLSTIIQILGSTRTPFAVKGGGHTANFGFSSTPGVQIAMFRFSEVTYNAATNTVDVGAGLVWDDVYAVLEPLGVNVVGGRVTGVGVAGFTLGGGYSWLSNQHGLTIDTVQAFELVLPNGTVTSVTGSSNPDLFFGLKGGFNNFGIVTKFTLKTFPQSSVWGGLITFTGNNVPAVNAATAKFASQNTDPKASLITTYNFLLGELGVSQLLFYNGPTPPSGLFDDFLAIPFLTKDVETRSFTSMVQASPSNATAGLRGAFNSVSVLELTPALIAQTANQSQYWGTQSESLTGTFISCDVEPFLSSYFSFSQGGAYPHSSSAPLLPLFLYFAWISPASDSYFQQAIKSAGDALLTEAINEGQDVGGSKQIIYPNYAPPNTPLSQMYGSNVPRLQSIKQQYDPDGVMDLAGGFKF